MSTKVPPQFFICFPGKMEGTHEWKIYPLLKHILYFTMNTASGTVPVQLTIHASDRGRSRRDVSKTTWYFFLVPRYDITIFFPIKEVLRPFSAYPSTTWVCHKELTNAFREDILIAAILWDKNIQCNLLETGCGLWNLSIALTWNIFLGFATCWLQYQICLPFMKAYMNSSWKLISSNPFFSKIIYLVSQFFIIFFLQIHTAKNFNDLSWKC